MADMRQELSHIDRTVEREHDRRGDSVTWFEFINPGGDWETPVYDAVFDYGARGSGGFTYQTGKLVPVLWVIETEDQRTERPEGRTTFQSIAFTVNYRHLMRAGLSQPWESTVHLRDVVYHDGRYYKLFEYSVKGRLQDDVAVSVRGTEIYIDQEMPFDPGPAAPGTTDWRFPPTFPSIG